MRQRRLDPVERLRELPVRDEKRVEPTEDVCRVVRLAGLERVRHGGADVRVVGREPGRDDALFCGMECLQAPVREVDDDPGEAAQQLFPLVGSELLGGELADRLQHRVALAGPPEQALLDERLERVDVGVDHRLGGLEAAPAREHGQPGEEAPLLVREELVRPGDRRAEGLLARLCVATGP